MYPQHKLWTVTLQMDYKINLEIKTEVSLFKKKYKIRKH